MSAANRLSPARALSSSRTDCSPFCRALGFSATLAFPAGVLGPVECNHGRWSRAAWRRRSRPAGVRPLFFWRFSLPAATRFGLGGDWLSLIKILRDPTAARQFSVLGFFLSPAHTDARSRWSDFGLEKIWL